MVVLKLTAPGECARKTHEPDRRPYGGNRFSTSGFSSYIAGLLNEMKNSGDKCSI